MLLNQWALKWQIPLEAINDLKKLMGEVDDSPQLVHGKSEAAVQTHVRLEASQKGARLWRNNSGGFYDETGRFVRYGLANDSEKLNKLIKSSDLIGITPILVTPNMIGQTIGQFTCYEVKPENWRYTGTEREQAQLRFIELVVSMGGRGRFVNRAGTL